MEQRIECTICGRPATVHAHESAASKSREVPRCKDTRCSKVCQFCWAHFVPEVIKEHMYRNSGYGKGCSSGPDPDPEAGR